MTDDFDRYGGDVLAAHRASKIPVAPRRVPAVDDLVVEDAAGGFCGAVVGVEGRIVTLEDRHGGRRAFPLGRGFLLEGEPVELVVPVRAPVGRARTASGSFARDEPVRARVARASRILVEGRHDAELVEKVWGPDLRDEGIVVEYLEGIDHLEAELGRRTPGADQRIGVLVDHLVPGSKEQRIADSIAAGPHRAHVLVVGHPFIDIWQSVRPARLGIEAWPVIPRGEEWKQGICRALGWPAEEQADIAAAWQRILTTVRTITDLEPTLSGRVEELIDFVTAPVE